MIPVNVVFSPDWWNRRFGISFEEPFYLDLETRIANDLFMRRALHELFGIGILPYEMQVAKELAPFGIHHCGRNLQKYADQYNQVDPNGRTAQVGVCCINMDGMTPDRNVTAMFQAVSDFEAGTRGK